MIDYNEIAKQVLKWNLIVNAYEPSTDDQIVLQADLCCEEAEETRSAITTMDSDGQLLAKPEFNWVEVLDGAIDQFVVLCKLLDQLQERGIDVEKAFAKVIENNYSKFIPNTKDGTEEIFKTSNTYADKQIPIKFVYNKEDDLWLLKNDVTGKLLKPASFVPVNLEGCVPESLK